MASGWKRAGNRRPAAVSSLPTEFEQIIQEARREVTQAPGLHRAAGAVVAPRRLAGGTPRPSRPCHNPLPPMPTGRPRRWRSGLAGAVVHPLDDLGVLAFHDRPLDLEARGEFTVLDVEVARQHRELLDRLPPLQVAVDPLDEAVDQLVDLWRGDDLGVAAAAEVRVTPARQRFRQCRTRPRYRLLLLRRRRARPRELRADRDQRRLHRQPRRRQQGRHGRHTAARHRGPPPSRTR